MCRENTWLDEKRKKEYNMIIKYIWGDTLSRVFEIFGTVLENSRMESTSVNIQHGDTSCLLHMLAVAYYSDKAAEWLGIGKNRSELIMGALLHDYFLYDWHDKNKNCRAHGFTHPSTALKNAAEDFELNEIEEDIIKKHMFPLTPIPPKYMASWIVCIVDKVCSLYETFGKNRYSSIKYQLEENCGELYEKLRR